MKNILVPIDFSECAIAALDAAEKWCEKFHSQLHLLHVKEAATDPQKISALIEKYPSAIFSLVEQPSSAWKAIVEYTERHSIDLIVIGSHGASGKSEYFLGSNTQKLVRMSDCPVLVIKKPLPKLSFDRVLFASQFRSEDLPVFHSFKNMVEPFLPELHLLWVSASIMDKNEEKALADMQVFESAAKPLMAQTHLVKSFSIDEGIRFLADDLKINLIGIGNHLQNPLRRMLVGSVVEALVNHSELPVLVVGMKDK